MKSFAGPVTMVQLAMSSSPGSRPGQMSQSPANANGSPIGSMDPKGRLTEVVTVFRHS